MDSAIETAVVAPGGRGAVRKRKARPIRRVLVVALLLLLIVFIGCWIVGVFGGNVRVVDKGKLYRSATLTGVNYTSTTAAWLGNDLESVLKRNDIKTVLCLRSGTTEDWYQREIEICIKNGIDHEDVPMSARELPKPGALLSVIDILDRAKYPVLIHCQAGADRTGLVSTLYSVIYKNQPLDRAEHEELTWRYAHFPVEKTRAMDEFFDLYRKTSAGLSLRDWIVTRYPILYAERTAAAAPTH